MKPSALNRPATGLKSANYTGLSSIDGGNSLSNFSLRSSYQDYTSWYQTIDTAKPRSSKSSRFDPLNQRNILNIVQSSSASKDPLASIVSKERATIYDKMKQLEKNIHELVESSYVVASRGQLKLALIKAQDAHSKMFVLKKIFNKNVSILEQSVSESHISNNSNENRHQKDYNDTTRSIIPETTGVGIKEGMLMVKTNLLMQLINNDQFNNALEIFNKLNNTSSESNFFSDKIDATSEKVIARLGVDIANAYHRQGQYQRALKFYRLTLDKIPSSDYSSFRIKIMCNIGLTFIKSKQFVDAITSYQHLMTDISNLPQRNTTNNIHHHQCGLHLILCHYIIKDIDSIKDAFQKLIGTNIAPLFDDAMNSNMARSAESITYGNIQSFEDTVSENIAKPNPTASISLVRSAIKNDQLQKLIKTKINRIHRSIIMSAKLLSRLSDFQSNPLIKKTRRVASSHIDEGTIKLNLYKQNTDDGLEFCLSHLRNSKYFCDLTSELEISKATRFIDKQQFDQALEILKMMESNPNPRSSSMATTNLSLLYLLKNDFDLAIKYAEHAILMDPFNANAHVNLGNGFYHQKNPKQAEISYKKSIEIDINCMEAYYNLALLYRMSNRMDESLRLLATLESTVKSFQPLMVQSIKIYMSMNDTKKSNSLLENMMNLHPMDPSLFLKMSNLAVSQDDLSKFKIPPSVS